MDMPRSLAMPSAEIPFPLLGDERIYLVPCKLKRVVEFIEANFHEQIRLVDLAGAAGLSPNHFLRVFKRATGDTPYQYLRARRLEHARHLLTKGSTSLAQLALDCGFANQAHFTAAFSREFGVPPGRYRRAIRAGHQGSGGMISAKRGLH